MFSWLSSLFSTPKATPPPPGMRTIPCSAVDLSTARDLVLTTGLVINARLDPERLEETLSKLIQSKFPCAGGRVAFRNGVYEFQIPETFDAGTPPARFTVEDYPEAYNCAGRPEIPIALRGPEPSVMPAPDLKAFLRSNTCPKSLEDFLQPNVPLLHIHVAVFNDLTFLGVTAPHIAFDALGTGTLLDAWTRALSGDDIDTIQGMERDVEPFESFTPAPNVGSIKPQVKRGWFDFGPLSQLNFIVRFLLRIIADPKEVRCFVRVPKAFLHDVKQTIMDELKAQGSSEYVGSSDVLMAWWLKTVYSHRAPTDHTPIHLHIVTDVRGKPIFADDALLAHPYIHNAVMTIAVPPLPVSAFRTESIGALALRMRRAIVAYNADPAGVRADLSWLCSESNALKTVFPGPPGAEFSVQSSWRAAKFGELDFSGAEAGPGDRTEKGKARVVFVNPVISSSKPLPMRGSGGVLMEDEEVIWMDQHRGEKDWERIRRRGEILFA
ncbi:hypothetical protein MVEN_00309200 [Mycena venus]|uniref:Uncharacterized protein n=1 Tax=Mycena venus TaxID=2733690 RepID=A0A8H6Z4K9_9AGAR|nr:hypothetical protein MVEN_00309200 [Mycena venus]